MADRSARRDDRRQSRDDHRDHRPRFEQGRSRSPPRRDRRDDRRRERSPPPRGPPSRTAPPPRSDRDRDYQRSRDAHGSTSQGRPNERQHRHISERQTNVADPKAGQSAAKKVDIKTDQVEDEDSEAEMRRIMGFKDFRTTKNTKVPGNDKNYAVHKTKKAEYRQYMNRVGGFNRPLSPSRM